MNRFAKQIAILIVCCLPPVALHASEAQHVLGGLKILVWIFFVILAVIICSIINFVMNNRVVNLITLLVSLFATIFFATMGDGFTIFNLVCILISGIGWLSILKYIRLNS